MDDKSRATPWHLIKPVVTRGIGTLTCGATTLRKKFQMVRYPHQTIFRLRGADLARAIGPSFREERNEWALTGHLSDGRPIRCARLLATETSVSFPSGASRMQLFPFDPIVIGQDSGGPPREVRYPLVGYFHGDLSLEDDGWTVKVAPGPVLAKTGKLLREGWNIAAEGHVLSLRRSDATLDEYEPKSRQVTHLLSLATGTGVTYHRYVAAWAGAAEMEVWRQGSGDEFGPGACVPSSAVQQLVEQALPVWRGWPQKKQDLSRLIIAYINVSQTGYLDTRLLQAWQAWEILAAAWGSPLRLTPEEKDLSERILQVYDEWSHGNAGTDPQRHLRDRLAFAFRWPQAQRHIHALAESRRLDMVKLGLDFAELKRARDHVAHKGTLPRDMSDDRPKTARLLRSAQFGLQLLLLVELGYAGMVVTERNGWSTLVEIADFLK